MDKLIKAGNCQDIPLGEGRKFVTGEEEIGLFNLGGEIVAISNRCPHQNGPLSDGLVTGDEVICPMHARKINLRTGCVANENAKVRVYEVVVQNGEIFVKC